MEKAAQPWKNRIKKLKSQLKKERNAMDFLQKFSEGLLAITGQKQLFRFCNICASEYLELDYATILLWIPERQQLLIKDTIGFPEDIIDSYYIKPGEGLAGYCFSQGKPAIVPDFHKEKRFQVPDLVWKERITSAIAVPMRRERDVAGVMIGHTRQRRLFSALEKNMFQAMASQSAVAIRCQLHQQKRKETEDRYSTIFNMVQDAIFIHDPDTGRILETNRAAQKLYRMSESELRQAAIGDLSRGTAPFSHEEALKHLGKVRETGNQTFRWHSRRADGTLFWSEVSLSMAKIAGKERIIAVVRDLTHRLAAEKKIAEKAAEFEAIFNSIRDIVVFADKDRRILKVNPAAEETTGFTSEELQGTPTRDVYVDARDHERIGKLFFSLDSPKTTKPFITRLKKKDGSAFHAEVVGGPVRSKDGQILGFLGVVRDISQRIAMEQKMQHVQKLESLGVLAGGIAHDFNNILMAILGNAELALEKKGTSQAQSENLKAIISAAHKASALCRQMLAYSGRGKFLITDIDLNELLQDIHNMLKMSINKKAVLNFNLSPEPVMIKADPSQIQQVIMNLIINASEALEDRRGTVTISTGFCQLDTAEIDSYISGEVLSPGRYSCLEISDNGCGMSEETKARIFEPFFTTKFTGRGLGMAAVLGIIRGHRGAIRIKSSPGRGTIVKIILPAIEGVAKPLPKKTVLKEAAKCNKGLILLVDDESSVLDVASSMLEFHGFSVITAENGIEAVNVFRKRKDDIDGVIMDLTMPEIDGIEACRRILEIDKNARILLSSGYDGDEITSTASSLNIRGFIHKPYRLSTLEQALNNLFQNSSSTDADEDS